MSKSRKKTQRQSVYGETVTSLNTNYQINQHLGIETIHEEHTEQKITNINNNNNTQMSYIDILRSMEKGNEITNTNDSDNKKSNIKMKRAMSMHPEKFDSILLQNYPLPFNNNNNNNKNTTPLKKKGCFTFCKTNTYK